MTRTRRDRAAHPGGRSPENFAAAKPLGSACQSTGQNPQPTAGELIRRLSQHVLDAAGPADAADRLRAAAAEATGLVADGRLERIAAAVALFVAGQAAGIGQTDALGLIRDTFHADGVR